MTSPQRLATQELGDRFRIAKWRFDTSILDVYEGRDTQLDRSVHLRLLKPLVKRHPEAVRSFLDAAKSAASVMDPNLVAVYDSGWMGGRLCLVTEAPGHRLAESLRDLSPDEVRRLATDCLRGLSAAHAAGLLHGNIDEHAVFVEHDGSGKLADIGLYAAVASIARPRGADEVAPSVEGDLRALATTLLKRSDGSDAALDRVLRQALAVEPTERFASTDAFAAALQSPDAPVPSAIPPRPTEGTVTMAAPVPTPRPARPPRRFVGFAAIAAAVAALVVVAWNDTDPPTPGRAPIHQSDLPSEIPR